MNKLILKVFLILMVFIPVSAMAGVSVHVSFPLPPPIIFPAPPEVEVVPGMDVYTVPDVQEEIFFSGGWWWRPWEGRWYRSRYYDRGWGYYRGVPSFHRHFYAGWRDDYRNHRWRGQPWQYQRVPHHDLNRNWRNWQRTKHWHRGGPGRPGGGPGPSMHRSGGEQGTRGGGQPAQGVSKSGRRGPGGPNNQGDGRR